MSMTSKCCCSRHCTFDHTKTQTISTFEHIERDFFRVHSVQDNMVKMILFRLSNSMLHNFALTNWTTEAGLDLMKSPLLLPILFELDYTLFVLVSNDSSHNEHLKGLMFQWTAKSCTLSAFFDESEFEHFSHFDFSWTILTWSLILQGDENVEEHTEHLTGRNVPWTNFMCGNIFLQLSLLKQRNYWLLQNVDYHTYNDCMV